MAWTYVLKIEIDAENSIEVFESLPTTLFGYVHSLKEISDNTILRGTLRSETTVEIAVDDQTKKPLILVSRYVYNSL